MSRQIALVMAGGGGTRLWPASTRERPKQVLPGLPEMGSTLLAATVHRLGGLVAPEDVYVVTTVDQVDAVRRALPGLDATQLIAEPHGLNTAPAVALSVVQLRARLGEDAQTAILIALPADHFVGDPAAFRGHLSAACAQARARQAVATLGIEPTRPDTGYGYMQRDDRALPPVAEDGGVAAFLATRFVEKPDLETARGYLENGCFVWNAGIFVMPLARIEHELARWCPRMWAALDPVKNAIGHGEDPAAATRRAYADMTAAPIDTAIMEKLDDIVVVPANVGWSDLGTWESLAAALPRDDHGNVIRTGSDARTMLIDVHECVVWNDDATVGVIGATGLAVVVSDGKVLVCPLDRAQRVRELVDVSPG